MESAPTKFNKKVGHIINVFSFVICPIFFYFKEGFGVKKIKMSRSVGLTFEDVCNKYLGNCRQRNLREGTNEVTKNTNSILSNKTIKYLRT